MEKELYQACSDGKVEDVRKLVQNSQININWKNKNDSLQTPFYIACYNGHIDIVKLLLNDNRVDINEANIYGVTPYWIACYVGQTEIVKLLLNDNRVDINKAEKDGWTSLHIACQNGHIEIVKLLLNDNRVDINKATTSGWTPFYIACYQEKTEVVKYLLESEKEMDINKKDNNGKTGLDWAKQKGNTDIVELIESFQMKIEDGKKYNKIQNENEEQKRKEAEKNLAEQRKKIEEEKRKIEEEKKKIEEEKKKLEDKEREKKEAERKSEEERKKEESKRVTYEIEHNTKFYRVKTTAKTLSELENDIKSKLKLESNELVLEFKEEKKGKYITLLEDDMEDLEDGMTIKVSTVSIQLHQNVNKIDNSKPKPSVFLTHTWVKDELNRENHSRVATVNKLLKAQGFQTWFDEDKMEGHIDQKMAEGIDESEVILVFITKTYMEKLNNKGHDNCKAEFTYAITKNKKMISIVMEPWMKNPGQWDGPLGIRLAGDLYVDMSETDSEFNISTLVERLQRK